MWEETIVDVANAPVKYSVLFLFYLYIYFILFLVAGFKNLWKHLIFLSPQAKSLK